MRSRIRKIFLLDFFLRSLTWNFRSQRARWWPHMNMLIRREPPRYTARRANEKRKEGCKCKHFSPTIIGEVCEVREPLKGRRTRGGEGNWTSALLVEKNRKWGNFVRRKTATQIILLKSISTSAPDASLVPHLLRHKRFRSGILFLFCYFTTGEVLRNHTYYMFAIHN